MKIESSTFNPMVQGVQNKPANVGIEQKMTAEINAYNQGTENTGTATDLLKTQEGALASVEDPLQQMRQLAVQASNGTYTAEDRQMIQNQIDGLKSSINDTLKNTEFNRIKLFDQNKSLNVQSSSSQGTVMQLENTSLESLGIADFDVTKDFDVNTIDSALKKVSDARSTSGSKMNALESTMKSNNIAQENLASSRANLEDDFATRAMDIKKQSILQQYQIATQNLQMQSQKSKLNILA